MKSFLARNAVHCYVGFLIGGLLGALDIVLWAEPLVWLLSLIIMWLIFYALFRLAIEEDYDR